jgi:alkylation response protein AidB-like acyl-CoA dehydrogenase
MLPSSTWAFPLSATCLGIAREAVSVVRAALLRRFVDKTELQLAEQSAVLATFAEAVSDIDVAHNLLLARARRLMETPAHPYTQLESAEQRRDIVYAVHRARYAVNQLMELSGGTGIYDDVPIQQLWRDCTASAAHASFGWNAGLAEYGRALLGLAAGSSDRFSVKGA